PGRGVVVSCAPTTGTATRVRQRLLPIIHRVRRVTAEAPFVHRWYVGHVGVCPTVFLYRVCFERTECYPYNTILFSPRSLAAFYAQDRCWGWRNHSATSPRRDTASGRSRRSESRGSPRSL